MNPVADNPLETRADFERAVEQLFAPLADHFSPGGARVRTTATGARFPATDAQLEGFARPLWGIAPLGVHADFDRWSLFRTGLANGTDPSHEEYWGTAGDHSQKHVEMAAIGLGLALVPERLWDPLSDEEQERLVAWLTQINDAELYDCNWLFFRVLVNTGLRSVGARHDWEATRASLDRLESFAVGDGWYTDGPVGDESPIDYYLPWAMHFYGLVYAALLDDEDPERAARFRDRAAAFADHHVHWFGEDGRAIPYGRSLTYRFAQAAFWGGLAFADVAPLSWGRIRGLWARNIRWWLDQPIFTDGGLLSVGYRYPTLHVSEAYNSPNSPYWAMKAFLPLALPADHPFWTADEEPLPAVPETTTQRAPGLVICRDEEHLFALAAGQNSVHGREKYTKFAYSADFGFSVAGRLPGPGQAGHDSALALSLDGDQYKIPESVGDTDLAGTTLRSRREPWDGVAVDSWVTPALPWHVRAHRVRSERTLYSEEGGFALARGENGVTDGHDGGRHAVARSSAGVSGLTALDSGRTATVVTQRPNTNLYHPRTVVPTLRSAHGPGEHWIATAVRASPDPDRTPTWDCPFDLVATDDGVAIERSGGERVLECSADTDL